MNEIEKLYDIIDKQLKEIEELRSLLENKLFTTAEQLQNAIDLINEQSSQMITSKRINSGNFKPAKRIDVDDDTIIKLYQSGQTPNKIAQSFGMTQPAIIYRLKKLGVYIEGGRNKIKEDKDGF